MAEKLAILTGASAGLGKELRHQLVQGGWQLIGLSRRSVEEASSHYTHISLDLSKPEACRQYFENVFPLRKYEGCTEIALINNAGMVDPVQGMAGIALEDLQSHTNLNLITPIWLMGFVQRSFPKSRLRVVNISSGAATKPYEGWGAYCSSKSALRMASQVFARENPNAQVISYAPGVIDTDMQALLRSKNAKDFPSLERFQNLYRDGELVDPALPAKELLQLLAMPITQENYLEKRYGA